MLRIVSLIASATEIVCGLGFEDQLVGRSHECDFPESIRRLPVCTEPKFNVSGSSGEIDRRVKQTLQESLSVYRVDEAKLKDLRPDVIVTQSHCEVCAVSLRDVEQAVGGWLGSRPRIVSLSPNRLEDVWRDIQQVAEVIGVPERGAELISRLRQRMAATKEKAGALSQRPTVACLEWIEPLMAAGNWMPELVEMAGGLNLFGEAGKHSPQMSWDDLLEKDPDVIVVLPCGFDIVRTRQDMPLLTAKPGWRDLRAVKNRKVYLADGNQFFNRPGPRLVESLEILAELLHPDGFHFGHEGSGWQRFLD
jgi:iron complex transport system substrate-binding protein